jgi:2-polyprenyl-3-methyl-5-hydroxy-6-metoxy-1,4-benzoquinol methylase
VVGVDSSELVTPTGLQTAPNAIIRRGDITQLASWFEGQDPDYAPDVVVAGEVIEHLANPLAFLRELKSIEKLRGRKLVVLSDSPTRQPAPNDHDALIVARSRRTRPPCILTSKTLQYLLSPRAGLRALVS